MKHPIGYQVWSKDVGDYALERAPSTVLTRKQAEADLEYERRFNARIDFELLPIWAGAIEELLAEAGDVAPTLNDVNVRLHVQLGASVVLGLYDGPITRETVAAHLEQMFEAGVQEFIEKIEIVEVATDDETCLVSQEGAAP